VGVSVSTILYNTHDAEYRIKICAYIYGPDDKQSYGCAIADTAYYEKWYYPFYWNTIVGKDYIGFIRSVYMWSFAKSLTNLYYSPLKNFPLKDSCSPYTD